jgi:hypothetical protein
MTISELYAAWARYMHRNDLSADLDTTFTFASKRIENAMLHSPVDLPQLLIDEPQLYLHAGLMQLAELAQDDEQAQRERSLFTVAASDYQLQRSLKTSTGQMSQRLTFGVNAQVPPSTEEAT